MISFASRRGLREVFFMCFFIIFTLFAANMAFGDAREEISELNAMISSEEAALLNLKKEKASAARKLRALESKIDNYKKIIAILDKEADASGNRLREINARSAEMKKNVAEIKDNIRRGSVFIIDNLGYFYMKVISSAESPENTVKTLEIISMATGSLEKEIKNMRAYLEELGALSEEQSSKTRVLEATVKERARALKSLKSDEVTYKNELTLLKNDEAGRKEYLEMLNFRRSELDNEIIKARGFFTAGDGGFSRKKGRLSWPANGTVTEPFGRRMVEEAGVYFFHKGIKIRPKTASSVFAVASGKVAFAEYMRGFGNLVILNHGLSYYTVYGNLKTLAVSAGVYAEEGTPLGTIDIDPGINTSYLYFEIRKNELALDPAEWLAGYKRR